MRNVPEWTKGNAFAKRFFKWLRKKNKPALLTWENVFTKTFNREFTFVYMGTNLENRASHLYQGMEFVGIFNQKTFEFTDVSYALRALLNIPEGKNFRFQRGCMRCLEQKVQEYAQKKQEKGKKDIVITAVERAAVAWKYRELIEKTAGDVIFEKNSVTDRLLPQQDFAFDGETYVFDNWLYFCYLRNRKAVIRRFGRYWAKELQNREVMRQIFETEVNNKAKFLMKKQPERIEKIRALRKSLEQVHHTVIVVVRGRQGVFEYFHIDAEVLKNTTGKYPLSQVSGQEKKRLKEKYGANKVWDVEEIYQVGARDIWYYNVMAEQKQAA